MGKHKFSLPFSCACLLLPVLLLSACGNIGKEKSAQIPSRQDIAHFVAFGDSGYLPSKPGRKTGLKLISDSMADLCDSKPCDFALMLGDNIYPDGATGNPQQDKPVFQQVLLDPFGRLARHSRDFRVYSMMGNHDWYTSRAGAMAQIEFLERTPPFYMNGPFYSIKPPSARGDVEIFVLDTEMLLASYQLPRVKIAADGSVTPTGKTRAGGAKEALPKTVEEQSQLRWFEEAIQASTAKWKIVAAHHPLWESNGNKHSQSEKLRELLMPTLCRHADAYFAGHQHTMEIHQHHCKGFELPLPHMISGAASKARGIHPPYASYLESTYPQFDSVWAVGDIWGFMHLALDDENITVDVYTAPTDKGDTLGVERAFTTQFKNRVD